MPANKREEYIEQYVKEFEIDFGKGSFLAATEKYEKITLEE